MRLRGKGLPRFGEGARGDLYVRLQLHVPERLTERQRQLYEQLRTPAPGNRREGRDAIRTVQPLQARFSGFSAVSIF